MLHGPEQPVGIPVGRSSFQGCGDHSSGEGEPKASQLGVVVVPAPAAILLGIHEFHDALAFGLVPGLVLFPREVPGIPESGEHDEGADFVAGRQTVQFVFSAAPWPFRPERVERYQDFCSDLVAPVLLLFRPLRSARSCVGERGAPQPQVGELVNEGEDLRGFGVSPVDEDERGDVIS